MAYNCLRTMRDNIEAIRLVLRLRVAGRTAQNAEERETLRKFANRQNPFSPAPVYSYADRRF